LPRQAQDRQEQSRSVLSAFRSLLLFLCRFCFVLCVCLTSVDWIKARVTHPSHLKAAAAAAAAAQTAELYAIGSTALHQLIESCI
jgi:hypothetical protein